MNRVTRWVAPHVAVAGLVATTALLAMPRASQADNLRVTVTEVAGNDAYLDAGTLAGLRPGTVVTFGKATYTVVECTDKTAIITVKPGGLKPGASGHVTIQPGTADATIGKIATPRPANTWHQQWPEVTRPADAQLQTIKAVPLGGAVSNGVFHLDVIAGALANIDPDGIGGLAEGRLIATYELMRDRPLAIDADIGVRAFGTGYDSAARSPVLVRTAQLRYGRMQDPNVALGRLRWASSSVGMLDGARVMARRGTFEVAAYGGVVPDPLGGRPDTGAARFGGEVAYDAAMSSWQPRVSLGFSGSTWNGAIDEKRLTAMAAVLRGPVSVSGWSEMQFFSAGNPWSAKAAELTGAGLSIGWRGRGLRASADATLIRPERSRRLEAALGQDWTCARIPQPGDVDEQCEGGDYWLNASGNVGLQRRHVTVDAGGTLTQTQSLTNSKTQNGYVRGELTRADRSTRFALMVAGNRGSYVDWVELEGALTQVWKRRFELQLRYRPQVLSYVADVASILQHHITADVRYAVNDSLDVAIETGGRVGLDRNSAYVLTTIAWRPLP
ncbi:MAG: hypothetical protein KBG15_07285 [Kofleriaceae bacterium]|nr:hypothetical protein [Kofleriaceae bacterium]